jgi:hypothetical protein
MSVSRLIRKAYPHTNEYDTANTDVHLERSGNALKDQHVIRSITDARTDVTKFNSNASTQLQGGVSTQMSQLSVQDAMSKQDSSTLSGSTSRSLQNLENHGGVR